MAVAPAHSRLRYVGAAAAPEQQDLSPTLLDRLQALAAAAGVQIDIFSGYRSDAYSTAHGGFAGDPHTRHIAVDAKVGGRPIGQVISDALFARFKLRTGDQPGFYHGQPDPSHVDLVGYDSGASPTGGLGFAELQQLWVGAGGPKSMAPVMAAIALAESSGRPSAHAFTHKEDSRGLWQINVRAHPQYAGANLYDPKVNAQAAVAVYRSQGLGAWSTYTNGSYTDYLTGGGTTGSPIERPGGGGEGDAALAAWYDYVPTPLGTVGTDVWMFKEVQGLFAGVTDLPGAFVAFFEAILWLFNWKTLLRAVEFLAGGGLIVLGLVAILLNFLSKDELPRTGPAAAATRVARRAARRTPPVRAVRRGRAGRQGRNEERDRREMGGQADARRKGASREAVRQSNRNLRREGRKTQSKDIPF